MGGDSEEELRGENKTSKCQILFLGVWLWKLGYIGWLLEGEAFILLYFTFSILGWLCLFTYWRDGAIHWIRVLPQRENVSLVIQVTLGISREFWNFMVILPGPQCPWFVKWGHCTRWSPWLLGQMEVSYAFILLCKAVLWDCIDLFSSPSLFLPSLNLMAEICSISLTTLILMARLPFWTLYVRETLGWDSNKKLKVTKEYFERLVAHTLKYWCAQGRWWKYR